VYGNSDNSDGLAGLLKRIDYPTYSEEYRYDNRNRLTQTIQILAASTGGAANTSNAVRYTTTKEYDARGNVISQVDPLGRKTQMEYDALNRLVKTTDPMTPTAGITRQIYDVRDNLRVVTDALGSRTQYEYDRANRMTKEIRPLGEATTYTYDANGNLTKRLSAASETRQYTFDAANRRTREQHFAASVTPNATPEATTPATNAARSISYTYDERGLLVGYTDSGDTNFATTSTSNPSPIPATGNSAVYEYDSKGLKTRETVTVQTSGSAGAALTSSNSTTKTTTTSYHPNGLKASITYPNVVGNHSTAAINSNASGNSAAAVSYTYDSNNQLKQITGPGSASNVPNTITISTYQWSAPTQKVLPGAVVNLTYDALLRPTRLTSQAIGNNGTTQAPTGYIIHDTRLTYNDVSNITQRETEHGLYTYSYDDLDRLTQVVPPASISFPNATTNNTTNPNLNLPIEGYRYDAVHNRKSSLHQTGSLANAWTYNAHHQLTQYGDPSATTTSSLTSILHPKVTQTFNANGHLTVKTVTPEDTSQAGLQAGKQSQRYTYSVSERLLRISDGSNANNGQGSEIARYSYDPFGRRIAKTVSQNTSGQGSTGTTLYFYADEGLIAEVDGNTSGGNITTTYGWMPNNTWGTAPQWKRDHAGQSGATDVQGSANTNGITHYVHVDHLGTSQRLTNTQGETTWRAVSEAFGKTFIDTTLAPATTGTTTNNLRFPGQYEDVETATHYNYMRTYLPMVGRYGESDPIGLYAGLNTYVYADGAPSFYSDPFGLDRGATRAQPGGNAQDRRQWDRHGPKKIDDPNKQTKGAEDFSDRFLDTVKCSFGVRACEAEEEIAKTRMCVRFRCKTTCPLREFEIDIKSGETHAYDPATTKCSCIAWGWNYGYEPKPLPGLKAPGR
jgi:RHS repeat-associated protein